jgi:hypothetical protein
MSPVSNVLISVFVPSGATTISTVEPSLLVTFDGDWLLCA